MKSTAIVTAAIAALLLTPFAVGAQAEKPAEAKTEPAVKAAAPKSSRSNVDARKCLELATNIEIHKCAEQYR